MSDTRIQDSRSPRAARATRATWIDHDDTDALSRSERKPLTFRIGDPRRVFAAIAALLAPVRMLRHLTWPLVLMAAYGSWFNWYEVLAHTDRIALTLAFWQNILIGLLTANLMGKVAQGVAMSRNGVPCPEFGFKLAFGFIPRFYIENAPIKGLDFPEQRNCYAAPLLFRLRMFAAGFLVWDMTRHSGAGTADVAVVLSGVGFGSFMFTANPLWPADGYRWLAARLERPRLRHQSLRVLALVLTFRGLPPDLKRSEFWLLLIYAVASIAFTAFIVFMIVTGIAYALESQFRGTGVVIFCLLLAVVALFLVALREKRQRNAVRRTATRAPSASARSGLPPLGARAVAAARAQEVGLVAQADAPSERRRENMAGRRQRLRSADPAATAPAGEEADALDALLADESMWDAPPTDPSRPQAEVRELPFGVAADSGLDDILSLPPTSRSGAEPGPDELDDVLSAIDDPGASAEDEDPGTGALRQPSPAGRRAGVPARRPVTEPSAPQTLPARPMRPGNGRSGMGDLDRLLNVGTARPTKTSRWRAAAFWLVLLGVLAYVAFLPYAFEAGGDFIVQPLDRAEVRSRTDGEVIQINAQEGDWVEKDQVIAVLSNWDEQRDVSVHEADIAKLRAQLATLTGGATPEQIAVAEQALQTAELQAQAAKQELDRQEALFATGTIAEAVVEQARDAHAVAVSNRDQAQASLDLVSAPTRDSEVDALRAEIARNEEELAFSRLMLENTNIRAPVSGQVVSSQAEVPVGAYLSNGGLFAQLEDNRTVIADVEIPEITINEVKIGAPAELRLWSDPETSLGGIVRSISPVAEERDFGKIIRVQVEVPNPDGHLAANMTGFGKIQAAERPVWQAFGRAIYRFFVIELWSWLP